ncbi:MAG: lipoprotein-releasing system permease protein [Pseudohongiellaceae bacterium]|jgi:lipoprotein-releasing system permease protein
MYKPLALFIGLRYTQAKRRNQFISFVSLISLLGMILGVFALIVVLSVMNGFQSELRDRILSVIPHGSVYSQQPLLKWQSWQKLISEHDEVVSASPFIEGSVMLNRNNIMRNAKLTAIDPQFEHSLTSITDHIVAGELSQFKAGEYSIVMGDILARYLSIRPGDEVTMMLPKVTITPMGVYPRVKRFKVVALFSVGAQLDSDTVFIHLNDGQKLFQLGSAVDGIRIELQDIFLADDIFPRIAKVLGNEAKIKTWQQTQGTLFQAMKMEKIMISLLLLVIVIIAAFNIISILTMMVADKRSDIAVLRTMGMKPNQVRNIFIIQGVAVGCSGIILGVLLGLPVAYYIGDIVIGFESILGLTVFNPNVYFISKIPSVIKWSDVSTVIIAGFMLSALATIYPAIRAAKIHPAEALRYE